MKTSVIKQLVWATDFSKESRYCLPFIKYFSENLHTKNHALYVMPRFSQWIYETAFFSDDDLLKTVKNTRQKALTSINQFRKRSGIEYDAQVIEGIASEEIIRFAHKNKIDLVLAGRRGISEIEDILIGSTTSRLIRNTNVPIMIVPKARRTVTMKKILCPIDFSEFSLRELVYALDFAGQFNAKLYVVHVSEFFNYQVPVFQRAKLIDKINDRIMGIAEEHHYRLEGIIYEEGEPGKKIIELAGKKKMDLIIMSTHQRKGIEKFFLGSITEKVLMYSETPVIILPPGSQ